MLETNLESMNTATEECIARYNEALASLQNTAQKERQHFKQYNPLYTSKAAKKLEKGKIKKVAKYITYGADPNITNRKGQNLAHLAMLNQTRLNQTSPHASNCLKTFKYYGGDLMLKDKDGKTPLCYALNANLSKETRKALLELIILYYNENQDSRFGKETYPDLIPILLAHFSDLDISNYLILLSNNSAKLDESSSKLMIAYCSSLLEKETILLEDFVLIIEQVRNKTFSANVKNSQEQSLAHLLVRTAVYDPSNFAKELQTLGVSLTDININQQTPFNILLDKLSPTLLEFAIYLLQQGVDVNSKNQDGKTFILRLTELVIQNNIEPNPNLLGSLVKNYLAAKADLYKDVTIFEQVNEAFQHLMNNMQPQYIPLALDLVSLGANPCYKPTQKLQKLPLLHYLAFNNVDNQYQTALSQLLTSHPAIINLTNIEGKSVLDALFAKPQFDYQSYHGCIMLLLEKGANFDCNNIIKLSHFDYKNNTQYLSEIVATATKMINLQILFDQCCLANQSNQRVFNKNLNSLLEQLLNKMTTTAIPKSLSFTHNIGQATADMPGVRGSQATPLTLMDYAPDELQNGWKANF